MARPEPKQTPVLETASAKTSIVVDVVVLSGLCILLLFWGLGDLPFFSRGDPREGLVVWEMHSSGNWILPAVNGEYIPFKPPLFHWCAALAGYLFGRIDEFTLRLPAAVFAALGVLITYLAGARLWGQRAGVVAGIVLVTSEEWWQAGTETQVDMTLAFFISAACLYFYFLYEQRDFRVLKCLGLPFLLGLATLSKGPVGLAVPCLAFLVFLSVKRDLAFIKKLRPFASAAVFLLVAGSWYGAALWQGGPAFFYRQIVDENFRTAAGTYGKYQPIYYYLPIFFENTLPWSFFFPPLIFFLYRHRDKLSKERLLFPLIWLVTVFIFFSVSLGKRGVYILPLYPAMALLFGAWWQQLEENLDGRDSLARSIGYFFAVSGLFAVAALLFYFAAAYGFVDRHLLSPMARFTNLLSIMRSLTPPSPQVATCLMLYAAALFCLIYALLRGSWKVTFAALTVTALSVSIILKTAIFSPIVLARTLKPFMLQVNEKIDRNSPLFFYRAFDLGAIFYAGRHIPFYSLKAHDVKPPLFLLMWEEDWQRLAERRDLKLLEMSDGTGPVGRHRMALVKYQPDLTTAPSLLPVDSSQDAADKYHD